MADVDTVRKEIYARNKAILDSLNRLDFDGALKYYTEDAMILVDGHMPIQGHEAMKAAFESMIPALADLVPGEVYYFDLINENTAYWNGYFSSVDKEGKTRAKFKDGLLWRKIDGAWYLQKDMFNTCPM